MRMRPQNLTDPNAATVALAITRFDACDSTNRQLLAAAESGAPAGSVFVARTQTAGRGRRGRTWVAEPGATLTFSLLWAFPVDAAALSGLPLAVGVAMVRGLAHPALGGLRPGVRLGLKWPNDLLLRLPDGSDAKAGGMLIESVLRRSTTGPREMAVVIGIGLNCLPSLTIKDNVPDQSVAALAEGYADAAALAPETLLPVLLDALRETLLEFSVQGFAGLRDEWLAAHLWQGEAIRVLEAGQITLEGELRGVDLDGALLVATPSGFERVVTGDVSLRRRSNVQGIVA